MNCPSCGFPIARGESLRACPKCDLDFDEERRKRPMVVDLAHRGETVSSACLKLEKAVNDCVWHGHPSLKVIHGYGSRYGQGAIRERVVKEMEKYAQRYALELRQDGCNEGAHVLIFSKRG